MSMNLRSIDPLDGRYFDEEISKYLSEKTRIEYQAKIEGVLAQTLADFGICSPEIANEIVEAAKNIDVTEVQEAEKVTRHDIKAIVNTIKSHISDDAKPYVHFGATSYDIVSNASALQYQVTMRELILPRIARLCTTLANLSEQYKSQPQVGRTHGQHAVPITFGYNIAEYLSRLHGSAVALDELSTNLPGKFSGAVGAYNALSIFVDDPIAFEKVVLDKIGLTPAEASTQIVPAEFTIRLIDELAIAAGIMANLSHDMRNLQRSEINETRERFEPGQTGSSTMAHKRNPWNFENVIGMSKQVTAQIINANMNISSEHQRDLTDSSSARFYPIVFACVASMTKRLDTIMQKIEVDAEAMERNLKLSAGAIAAEPLYLLFEKHGHIEAHEMAKTISHQAIEKGQSLSEAVQSNQEAREYWDKFSDFEKSIITSPETTYFGRAIEKTENIVNHYKTSNILKQYG